MKRKDIYISLYVLVPAIFSGISVITVIVAYRITSRYPETGVAPDTQIIWLVAATAAFTFACSYLIIRLILKPIFRFIKTAKNLPVMSQPPEAENISSSPENIEYLDRFLDQVTTILGNMEATELFPEIIGQSKAMRMLFSQVMKVAPTDATVLIIGESGTGKELLATSIYEHSPRKGKPFIKLNCVAIPEGLLESELFGHEKGAFTGAASSKKGKFEIADSGTILLDEIGDMPLATQAKILRVLQEKEFERVGGSHPIKVDVRFIAATNRNIPELITTGRFREDLYHRLNVFSQRIPPLRERRDDILILAEYFMNKAPKHVELSLPALKLLLGHNWPGNVRELKNTIERAAVMTENELIEPYHLPHDFFENERGKETGIWNFDGNTSLDDWLQKNEKEMIIEALKRAGGVQVRAAQLLGINQRSLWHRIRKYTIDASSFKNHQML